VTGAINAGGLIGVNGAAVFSSYWDIDNSNQNQSIGSGSSYGMIGLKTVQMKGTHAYDNMTDFNFEENWLLTEGYPALYWQDVDSIPIPTSTTESNEFPQTFKLKQNYPNPFNGTTIIEYGLPSGGDVLIDVYNLLGQKISTLVNSNMSAGWHEVTFDAERYSSGVYIYRLQVSDFVETKKFTLIK
ncbi:MAG: T9SS type A sorting domain-containing protein, partial [Candidatus Paceibacterota bacterium]